MIGKAEQTYSSYQILNLKINNLKILMYPKASLAVRFRNTLNEQYIEFEANYKNGPVSYLRIFEKQGVIKDHQKVRLYTAKHSSVD